MSCSRVSLVNVSASLEQVFITIMMPDINYIQLSFSLLISSMIILGSLMNSFEKYLPLFIRKTFRYGKFSCEEKSFVKYFEVPKSSFKQFYKAASVLCALNLILVISIYVFNCDVPGLMLEFLDIVCGRNRIATIYFFNCDVATWIIEFLNIMCGRNRVATTSPASVFLATILFSLQCYRRFYDTHFVSVFSKNGKINIVHYVVGMLYYPACMLAILCEAPKFTMFARNITLQFSDLTYLDVWATGLFIWAWWHQHVTSVILGNLRKDKKGRVVTEDHKLPEGDWFDHLSSPHQVAEILMYFALSLILRYNITWIFVFGWVLSSQVETSILSHQWYKNNFSNYPKERKAVIPFIY